MLYCSVAWPLVHHCFLRFRLPTLQRCLDDSSPPLSPNQRCYRDLDGSDSQEEEEYNQDYQDDLDRELSGVQGGPCRDSRAMARKVRINVIVSNDLTTK